MIPQLALLLTAINSLTTIAPNFVYLKHALIYDMASSNIQDDKLKDNDIADFLQKEFELTWHASVYAEP
jgi:hypothetical protein